MGLQISTSGYCGKVGVSVHYMYVNRIVCEGWPLPIVVIVYSDHWELNGRIAWTGLLDWTGLDYSYHLTSSQSEE